MARSLGRVAGDLFASVLVFQSAPDSERLAAPALRQEVLRLLEAIRRDPDAAALVPGDVEEACFALVAWSDEMIMRTPWAGHDEWVHEPLQLQLYRTNKAGDEFYEHLERLRPEQSAAREVYFLCLALGFEGQYAGSDAERRSVMQNQYEMLRAAGAVLDVAGQHPIVAPAYVLDVELDGGGGRRLWPFFLTVAGIAGLAFAVAWIVLRVFAGRVPVPEA